jgi:drug/metabolite transporter (DMT)-like permease
MLRARRETRRYGKPPARAVRLAWLAGAFFAADLILWHNGIEQVGAGLATVLGNTQVVLVGLLAWAILGERPQRSALTAIPIVAFGVLLISGVLESGAYGSNPGLGVLYGLLTGLAYSPVSCSPCARGAAISGGLPARSSQQRSPRRSAALRSAPSSATST